MSTTAEPPTTDAPPVPGPAARYPALAGRYRLLERIARGGMGEVWRAHDEVLGRAVAVKVLRPEYADEEVFLERFRSEARNTAALSHTGIAAVHDFGQARSGGALVPFIVMELVPGEPLSVIIERDGALEPDLALDLVAQAARALQAAHAAGIVHRDVKPANLLVTPSWAVKVTDFGIARAGDALPLTRSGTVMGTAHYLAPELVSTKAGATPSSDVYALGVVLYESLAGHRPFAGDNPLAVAMAHLHHEAPPIRGLPAPVRELLDALLAKTPDGRPASAAELAQRIVALRIELAAGGPAEVVARAFGSGAEPGAVTAPAARRARGTGTHRRGAARLDGPLARPEPPAVPLPARSAIGNDPSGVLTDPALRLVPMPRPAGERSASAAEPPEVADVPVVAGVPETVAATRAPLRAHRRPVRRRRAPVMLSAAGSAAALLIGLLWAVDSDPATGLVPAVSGVAEHDALAAIESRGFGSKVVREVNETVPAGVVLGQSPQPGARAATTSAVEILVSSGPPTVVVDPADWVGSPYLNVRSGLESLGLRVEDRHVLGDGVPGTVTDVRPQGRVPVGNPVVITVLVGPLPVTETTQALASRAVVKRTEQSRSVQKGRNPR